MTYICSLIYIVSFYIGRYMSLMVIKPEGKRVREHENRNYKIDKTQLQNGHRMISVAIN